jgi:NTP pyrophosphatase (non-canonical NTP hydrolase)
MEELQLLMNNVHKWADETFGKERKPQAVVHHLKEECNELIEALNSGNKEHIIEEFSDCFILINDAASKYGLTALDLIVNSFTKLDICKNRIWEKPDENGVCRHIKTLKQFQCPYEDISCDKLNTLTMKTSVCCTECNHFNNGIKFNPKPSNHV